MQIQPWTATAGTKWMEIRCQWWDQRRGFQPQCQKLTVSFFVESVTVTEARILLSLRLTYSVSEPETKRQIINVGSQHRLNPCLFIFPVSPRETTVIVDPTGPVLEGSSVSLICKSRSNPPVTNYTWYRDNEMDKEPGPVLVIDGADTSHSGDYHCTAKNDLGEETSAAIQLDIQCELI